MAEKKAILKKVFGYDSFREGQEEIIESIINRRDTFCIMPTAAGKSICYQLPALLFEGISLVISPLISLMKDQVSSLNQAGIHAAYLNSSLTAGQYRKALELAKAGKYKIIYVAPERLTTEEFLDFAKNVKIEMVAVDEVHCVSQWGQDFRPSYLKIIDFMEHLPKRPVLAGFTGTATREVKEDIISILQLNNPKLVITGFDRKNLEFSVQSPINKYQTTKEILKDFSGKSGVIYCGTRKTVEILHDKLQSDGIEVTKYHAGLTDEERSQNQDDFIYDRKSVMIATNAFGMGIDKSDVRFVLHYNMPKNMEGYYQEAGRAGRDGEPAQCILLYGGQDVITNQFFIEKGSENSDLDADTLELVREKERERLKKMTYYCFTTDCLREYILKYFGEDGVSYCGNCSNCLTQFEEMEVSEITKQSILFLFSSRERFGINLVADGLCGMKSKRITETGLDKVKGYGVCQEISIFRMKRILQNLVAKDYLYMTPDEYSILKITEKGTEFLTSKEPFYMKIAKEVIRQPKEKKGSSSGKGKNQLFDLSAKESQIFEELRALRLEIAREEKMPPYIIFSDKTLKEMAIKKPKNQSEMLQISGIGEVKFEKYGERFLEKLE